LIQILRVVIVLTSHALGKVYAVNVYAIIGVIVSFQHVSFPLR